MNVQDYKKKIEEIINQAEKDGIKITTYNKVLEQNNDIVLDRGILIYESKYTTDNNRINHGERIESLGVIKFSWLATIEDGFDLVR